MSFILLFNKFINQDKYLDNYQLFSIDYFGGTKFYNQFKKYVLIRINHNNN